jgi:hypothetical protein
VTYRPNTREKKMSAWHVTVKRVFIETKELTKKGESVRKPIDHRHLYLVDADAIGDSGDYRINLRINKAAGTKKYTISVIPQIRQSIWSNPKGIAAVWFKKAEDFQEQDEDGQNVVIVRPFKRTADKPITSDEAMLRWLSAHMGEDEAKKALCVLNTAEPMKKAA